MKEKTKKNLPIIIISFFALLFIFIFYGKILIHPNDYMFADGGEGSYKSMKKAWNRFAEFPPYTFEKDKGYDISMWFYNNEQDALNLSFKLIVEEHDVINDQRYWTLFSPDMAEVINGNWSLVEGVFTIKDSKNRVYIVSEGKENSKAALHADDLLIKDKGTDIYKYLNKDSLLFYNNHKISLKQSE